MAEPVSQLRQQLKVKGVPVVEAARDERDAVSPNLDRLTVGPRYDRASTGGWA